MVRIVPCQPSSYPGLIVALVVSICRNPQTMAATSRTWGPFAILAKALKRTYGFLSSKSEKDPQGSQSKHLEPAKNPRCDRSTRGLSLSFSGNSPPQFYSWLPFETNQKFWVAKKIDEPPNDPSRNQSNQGQRCRIPDRRRTKRC